MKLVTLPIYPGVFMLHELFLYSCVLVWAKCRSVYRLKKQRAWYSVKGGKWQDYRDQRSNQSPAVRVESSESGSGGGGEFDGKRYRKVF